MNYYFAETDLGLECVRSESALVLVFILFAMHLLRSAVYALLVATSLAHPGGGARKDAAIKARSTKYALKQPPLTTPWTDKVGTDPWPEYPRPQMQRSAWQNLNGVWQYRNASGLSEVSNPPFGQDLGQEVLVPSCLESGLSGKWLCCMPVGV